MKISDKWIKWNKHQELVSGQQPGMNVIKNLYGNKLDAVNFSYNDILNKISTQQGTFVCRSVVNKEVNNVVAGNLTSSNQNIVISNNVNNVCNNDNIISTDSVVVRNLINLKLLSYNMYGLSKKDSFFYEMVNKFDIIFLFETHLISFGADVDKYFEKYH